MLKFLCKAFTCLRAQQHNRTLRYALLRADTKWVRRILMLKYKAQPKSKPNRQHEHKLILTRALAFTLTTAKHKLTPEMTARSHDRTIMCDVRMHVIVRTCVRTHTKPDDSLLRTRSLAACVAHTHLFEQHHVF